MRDRAVAVVLREGRVLVIRRVRAGARYAVLPGGGVEDGETPGQAVVREVREETGLPAVVREHLWTLHHPDRTAYHFAVDVAHGPLVLGGPEAARQGAGDRHLPDWLALDDLLAHRLEPAAVVDLLRGLAVGRPDRGDGHRR